MGKSSGGGAGATSTTSTSAPWSESQPYLKDLMSQAQNWYNSGQGSQQFPGSTSVPLSQDTMTALDMIRQKASLGSPLMGAANQNAQDTIEGKYLSPDSNPYLKDTFNQASNAVNSAVNGQFSAAGRYGSGAQTGVLADKNNQLATDIYGGNYQAERARQAAMTGLAPSLASADYNDANALLGAGNVQQQQSANDLQSKIDAFYANQNNPLQRLQSYNSLLQGFGGLGGTTTGQGVKGTTSNPIGGALGGAASGAAIGSVIPGLGTGIGAGIGGLLGLFSDSRLKKNIKRVGTLMSGIPVYSFNYIWGGAQKIGVMAQDVLKIKPEAVSLDNSGFYKVNYYLLGE